ncbi:ELYS-like, partial [Brachionus plicatilis]
MALNLQETELISTFDYGISLGDVISGSEYIWCINSKDNCLTIKSSREVGQTSMPYHDFGILSNEKFSIITGADFEYKKQKYLVLSVEVCGQNKRNLLTVFKLSVSKVTCTFLVPYRVTNLQVLVKNVHFIENGKNASFFGNFEVSCLAACAGGAVQVFDITPGELDALDSNEAQPLDVYWVDNSEHLVNEDIERGKQIALKQSKVFGFFINRSSLSKNSFDYVMANDQVTTSLPTDLVKVTSLKYEKQIDSVLIGFNFGCFQVWSMKTLSIESSSGYGENSKPVVGFSLLQPQNDPQKCVYLIVAHSRSLKEAVANYKKPKMEDLDETNDENQSHEFEIDDDDDES